jgi:hypothetical protein
LKRNFDEDDIRAVHVTELRSRIDESLISLYRGEGTDGEKFMQGMLNNLPQEKNARFTL